MVASLLPFHFDHWIELSGTTQFSITECSSTIPNILYLSVNPLHFVKICLLLYCAFQLGYYKIFA